MYFLWSVLNVQLIAGGWFRDGQVVSTKSRATIGDKIASPPFGKRGRCFWREEKISNGKYICLKFFFHLFSNVFVPSGDEIGRIQWTWTKRDCWDVFLDWRWNTISHAIVSFDNKRKSEKKSFLLLICSLAGKTVMQMKLSSFPFR